MKKRVVALLTMCVMICVTLFSLVSCALMDKIGVETKTLSAPTNVRVENGSLYWNPVEYASGYTVSIDNKEYLVSDYQYSLTSISDGEHVFKVKANGDGILYVSSGWSEECRETITDGQKTSVGYYGQFDELTKNESFLGYGFDVINSSVFSDKYVKTSFPIFNTEKLMEQRLLKVDSKQTYIEEIQSSDMETFMQDWNAKANVNVKWGAKKVGGSVEVKTKYSGGVENAKSKYFHSISFNNQKFYIVLQSDINTYKNIVNDSFKADLYSDMEPAQLFERYGTHFITSAVMGGKINSYYLYTSESEKSYHNISAQVSTEVRAFKTGVDVSVGGGYKNTAKSENIHILNTLEVIGGSDFGMMSDEDISRNYLEWEKSLNDHASLMGIKDTSSLIPLWQLIDSSLDTRTYTWVDMNGVTQTGSRAQQLQAYFEKYGVEAYNDLMRAAELPTIITPESIDNVKVNNNDVNSIGEYEVYAGANNDISFTVSPDKATGYTKSASLSENTEFASIENKNGLELKISANCPHNSVFNVVLSAGSVRKTITVRVVKRYTVTFETNGGTAVESYRNVLHGTQIDEPATTTKEGYVFKGWFADPNFAENSLYVFGANAIMDNLTLYAKWEKYYPEITFEHNVQGSSLLKDKVQYSTAYTQPQAPELTGYVFDGFYQDKEMLIPFDFSTLIKEPTIIYVKWEVYYPEITFVHNVQGSSLLKDEVKYNTAYIQPQTPKLEGYVFAGFYKDGNMQTEFDFSTLIKEPTTIYVKWEEYYPEITFEHNVQGSSLLKDKVQYNAIYANPGTLSLEGHDFVGYYSDEDMLIPFDFTQQIKVDTTIYVKWQAKKYTVTFDSKGGSALSSIQNVEWGTKIKEPNVPTKTGYVFGNWYKDSECANIFDFNKDVIKENTTLYASWLEDPITISFESNGGALVDERKILKGESLGNNLPACERDYYTFDGWYLSRGLNTEDKVYSYTVFNDSTTLYAKWTKNTYTIMYDSNGGILSGTYTTNYQLGDTAKLPTVTKDYYTFGGWFMDSSYIKEVNVTELKNAPQTITAYAKWTKSTYTIMYSVNGGALSGSYTTTYQVGDNIMLPTATRDYYAFDGWFTNSYCTTAVNITALKTAPQNITLYAKWEKNTYTITYNANGGTLSGTYTTNYQLGDTAKLPTVTKDYYTFGGWFMDSSYLKEVNVTELKNAPQTITAYAKWTKNTYTITYNANGGTLSGSYTTIYQVGDNIMLPTATKSQYAFEGWFTNSSCTTAVNTTALKTAPQNITLYAKWKLVEYKVTFCWGGNSQTYYVAHGNASPTPTVNDLLFGGWDKDTSSVTSNMVVNAIYLTKTSETDDIENYFSLVPEFQSPKTIKFIPTTGTVRIDFSSLSVWKYEKCEIRGMGYNQIDRYETTNVSAYIKIYQNGVCLKSFRFSNADNFASVVETITVSPNVEVSIELDLSYSSLEFVGNGLSSDGTVGGYSGKFKYTIIY